MDMYLHGFVQFWSMSEVLFWQVSTPECTRLISFCMSLAKIRSSLNVSWSIKTGESFLVWVYASENFALPSSHASVFFETTKRF